MKDAMLICARCRHAEYVSSKFVGKKFFCHNCGNLAVVVDSENLKKIDLSKLNITVDESDDKKFIVNDDEHADSREVKEALSQKYKQMIINEISNTNEPAEEIDKNIEEEHDKYENIMVLRLFNSIYEYIHKHTNPDKIDNVIYSCVRFSQHIISLVAVLLVVVGAVIGYRSEDYQSVLLPWFLSALMLIAQYISINSIELTDKLEKTTIHYFSSELIFRKNAMFIVLFMMVIFSFFSIYSFTFKPIDLYFFQINSVYSLFLTTILLCFVLYFFLIVFVHPQELLNMEENKYVNPSEEFLNICSLSIKSIIKISPIIYFSGCLHIGILLFWDFGNILLDSSIVTHSFLKNKTLTLFYITIFLPLLFYYFSLVSRFLIEMFSVLIKHSKGRESARQFNPRPVTPEPASEQTDEKAESR
ncbi:MAG: hypothetical protein K5657_03695 [Desulfovibrio sp.]|nr:hypothetical protein [Desulfovibrio sp.]